MEKKVIEKEHITTREGLHNLMMSYNLNEEEKIDKMKLSKAIYELIDDTYNANSTENDFESNIKINMYFQHYFRNMLFFKYNEDNYIYWIEDKNKSDEFNYKNKKEFIECLLDNYYDLDSEHLMELLAQTKEDLNYIIKSEQFAKSTLEESYNNYDYIKVLKNNHNISIYDISCCKQYLELSDNDKSDFKLTIDEKVFLSLIILYGLKNMYFYTSDLYKNSIKEYYEDIDNIKNWIKIVEENKDNITKDRIYSKEYEQHINKKDIIGLFSMVQEKDSCHIIRRYINQNYIKESIQLIYFDYILNYKSKFNSEKIEKQGNVFEEARKYLNENPIYLFLNLDKNINLEMNKDDIVKLLVDEIIKDYKINKWDTIMHDADINDLLNDNDYKNKYVIPILRFIIDYLYLLKAENKTKQVDCLYSFLKIFEKGFGIDDFFVKFNYELLFSKIKKIDKVGENADIDNIDDVINEISNTIENANLIDKQDIEKVEKIYPYIDFRNLNPKVKNYIATGDTIMLVFNDSNNIDFDYSSAVIEWSKAVELEAWEKLTMIVKRYNEQICTQIDPINYIKRADKRELSPKEVLDFKFKPTIGTFEAIDIRFMKDGRSMRKYLYDNYFCKYYDLEEETYKDLIDNILLVHDPRNKSAHKDTSIKLDEAKACQTVILSAKKILEVLSNLKPRIKK